MTLVEAKRIIEERWHKEPTLTAELATKMRVIVGTKLDDSVALRQLYIAGHTYPDRTAGLDWQAFMLGLNSRERQVITHSLGSLAFMKPNGDYITVGDIRKIDDIKVFAKRRGQNQSLFGISFFKLAFERDDSN